MKQQPQAIEIEKAVLGALLIESKAIDNVELQIEDFYDPKHQTIYEAILGLKLNHKPIDTLTIIERLKSQDKLKEAGNVMYIAELSDMVASSAHIEYHSAIIKQKSIARKLILQSNEVIEKAYNESEDVQSIIEFVEKGFTEITTNSTTSEVYNIKESIKLTLQYLSDIQLKREKGGSVGIPTGLKELDNQLSGGWSAPDLIVLGGRASMGKTQFALQFAKSASSNGFHCLFVSIEMTIVQLILRILTEDDRLSFYNMKTGQMTQQEWEFIDEKIAQITDDKLLIADDHNIRNLNNIKSQARKLHRQGKLDLLIIDYLQLIKTNMKFGTRDLEIGYITGELKNLAKELNIPIILLAQLNRGIKGTVSMPVLSDLRESGNIEQDADKVIFPHRPTYYDDTAVDKDGKSWHNRGVLIIGKNREGEKDAKIYFKHDNNFKKIFDDDQFVSFAPQEENPF